MGPAAWPPLPNAGLALTPLNATLPAQQTSAGPRDDTFPHGDQAAPHGKTTLRDPSTGVTPSVRTDDALLRVRLSCSQGLGQHCSLTALERLEHILTAPVTLQAT